LAKKAVDEAKEKWSCKMIGDVEHGGNGTFGWDYIRKLGDDLPIQLHLRNKMVAYMWHPYFCRVYE